MPTNYQTKIMNMNGFDGFVDRYDSIGAVFLFDKNDRHVETVISLGLPKGMSKHDILKEPNHPFWMKFSGFIVSMIHESMEISKRH